MSFNENIEQAEKEIEISIENAKYAIKKRESLLRLFENQDFKDIFEEGYFKEEPARLVGLLADSEFESDESQKKLHQDMMGISVLRQYFLAINQMGLQMESLVKSSEAELDKIRAEGE